MTTSYDTESNTQTVAAGYDAEPNTETVQTVAAAWAASPLGQPDREVGIGFADPTEPVTEAGVRRPVAKHSIVALALAGGIGAGAALGLMFFDFTPNQPAVAPGVSSPEHAVVVTESGQPSGNDVPAPMTIAPAPASKPGPADVATPPASTGGGPSEVVDVAVPDPSSQPEKPAAEEPESPKPEDPTPEPPKPEDPGPEDPQNPWHPSPSDLDLTNPEPEPGPEPPAPADVPDDISLPTVSHPQPELPDFDISAGS